MKRLFSLARLVGRSEKLLAQAQLRQMSRKTGLMSLAGLIAVFGLAMMNGAFYFLLEPLWGSSGAAFAVAAADFAIAGGMMWYAQKSEDETSIEEIRSVRDMAVDDLEKEVSIIESEITQMRTEVQNFLHNPLDHLKPSMIVQLMKAATEGLRSVNKMNGAPRSREDRQPHS